MNLIDMIRDAAAANGRTLDDVMTGANASCFQSDVGSLRTGVYGPNWAIFADVTMTSNVYFSAGIDAPVSATGSAAVLAALRAAFAPATGFRHIKLAFIDPARGAYVYASFDDGDGGRYSQDIDVAVPQAFAHRLQGIRYNSAAGDPYAAWRDIQDVVFVRCTALPGQDDNAWDSLRDFQP